MVGNISNFRELDVVRCLLKIKKPVSRSNLSKMLGLGEGTVRSILDILKDKKLIVSDKKGHSLSDKGNSILEKIKSHIVIGKVNLGNMFGDKKKMVIHIKNPKKIEKAYELRDVAVKNGADGALIFGYDKGLKLYDADSDYSSGFKEVEDKFKLRKDDIVIMAYADSYNLAEYGALAVAVELCDDLLI